MIEFVNIRPATFSTSCTYTVIIAHFTRARLRFERVISDERSIDISFFLYRDKEKKIRACNAVDVANIVSHLDF